MLQIVSSRSGLGLKGLNTFMSNTYLMKTIRIYLPEELEKKFRKISMETYGYSRGALSKAAVEALRSWIRRQEVVSAQVEIPREPVKAVRGLLRHVAEGSVELQHQAAEMRARKAKGEQ